jgi:hypothetical protein
VRQVLANPNIALADRVRLGFALAAVIGTMIAGPELFAAELADIADDVRSAIRDLFD